MSFPLARSTFTAASTCRRLLSSSAVRSAPPPSDASSSSARGQGPMSNALAAVAEGEIQRQAVSGRVLGFGAPANRQRGGFGAIQSAAGHAPNLRPANIGPFVKGQYYKPRDLNSAAQPTERRRIAAPLLGPPAAEAKLQDPLHQLKLRPGHPSLHDDSYKNAPLLRVYITEMGKIKSRAVTGLTRRSQREVGKAVRRARAMGLLPTMSSAAADRSRWEF